MPKETGQDRDSRTRSLIVTTVGTSLFSNQLQGEARRQLGRNANAKGEELSPPERLALDRLAEQTEEILSQTSETELRRLSAELNCLYAYWRAADAGFSWSDHHVFLTSDTYVGKLAGDVLARHIRRRGTSAEVHPFPGLNVQDSASFHRGVQSLIRWCTETMPDYHANGFHIVFNLAGSFKVLQSYMTILGMLYADEIIYIFDSPAADLIRVPRLPLRIDEVPVLEEEAALLARMAHDYLASADEVSELPETFYELDNDGIASISDWGLLLWEQHKTQILGKRSLPLPLPLLEYQRSFLQDFQRLEPPERARIQEELVKVSQVLEADGLMGLNGSGWRYSELHQRTPEGQRIGHFRISRDMRITCISSGPRLVLRRVGHHDIEADP